LHRSRGWTELRFFPFHSRCQEIEAENAQLKAGIPTPAVGIADSKAKDQIDRLNAELDTANRRANLLESDLARLREAHRDAQRQLAEIASRSSTPAQPIVEGEMDVPPSSSVSSNGDSEGSGEAHVPAVSKEEVTPKNLMMALLMLLSPLLTHEAQPQEVHSGQQTTTSSSFSLFPPQMSNGFIPSTPFEQFLKPDPMGSFDPSSFYTNSADLDMSATLDFSMLSMAQQAPGGGFCSSVETGCGEMDFLKSPLSTSHPSNAFPLTMVGGVPVPACLELDVEIVRAEEDPSKVHVRLSTPSPSTSTSGSPSSASGSLPPADFLGFPPSPITGLDGLTYSYSTPAGASGKVSERRRVRISVDETQGWDLHVEEC